MYVNKVCGLQDESTALIVAARKGDRNTVVRLVKNGANILAEDNVSRPLGNIILHRERSTFLSKPVSAKRLISSGLRMSHLQENKIWNAFPRTQMADELNA